MHASELTIDLGAIRRNARTLLRALDGAELWAVVKADGYGHGAVDVARRRARRGRARRSASRRSARRCALRDEFRGARILVLGPAHGREVAQAREARLELVRLRRAEIPEGVPVHLKLDTGMGR